MWDKMYGFKRYFWRNVNIWLKVSLVNIGSFLLFFLSKEQIANLKLLVYDLYIFVTWCRRKPLILTDFWQIKGNSLCHIFKFCYPLIFQTMNFVWKIKGLYNKIAKVQQLEHVSLRQKLREINSFDSEIWFLYFQITKLTIHNPIKTWFKMKNAGFY